MPPIILHPQMMLLQSLTNQFLRKDLVQGDYSDLAKYSQKKDRGIMEIIHSQKENSSANDLQQYLSCFNWIGSDYTSYSITLYVDLPVDTDPSAVFDPISFYAGHCFIELSKSNPFRTVRKVIGWYPNSGVVAISGIPSKGLIADDGGHEFQASYRISVDSAQFEATLQTLQSFQNRKYHISSFNCVDFVLELFNAAGVDIQLPPRYHIPIVGSKSGDHTPNGLYEKIQALQNAGVVGAMISSQKKYCLPGTDPCVGSL
jgi:hypothetical protein